MAQTMRERFAELGMQPFFAYVDPREAGVGDWYVVDVEDSIICQIPHDILMFDDESSLEGVDNPAQYFAEKIAALLREDFFAAWDKAEEVAQ